MLFIDTLKNKVPRGKLDMELSHFIYMQKWKSFALQKNNNNCHAFFCFLESGGDMDVMGRCSAYPFIWSKCSAYPKLSKRNIRLWWDERLEWKSFNYRIFKIMWFKYSIQTVLISRPNITCKPRIGYQLIIWLKFSLTELIRIYFK